MLGCHSSIHTEYECGIPRDFPAHKTLLPSADHQTERSESPTPEHNFVVVGFVTAFGAFMLHSEGRFVGVLAKHGTAFGIHCGRGYQSILAVVVVLICGKER